MPLKDPRLRSLLNEARERGYVIVLEASAPPAAPGGPAPTPPTPPSPFPTAPAAYTARLYCVAGYRRDCRATGETPLAAAQAVILCADEGGGRRRATRVAQR